MRASKVWWMLIFGVAAGAVLAQNADDSLVSFGKRTPSVDEVARALGVDASPVAESGGPRSRGIALGGSTAATRAGAKLKAMDMDVQFAFGSNALSPRAKQQLIPLGEFLKTTKLESNIVVIEGHTDSLGSADFATELSTRRAESVRDFLVTEYKLDASNFVTVGRGKQQPKDRADLTSDTNRRIMFYVRSKE